MRYPTELLASEDVLSWILRRSSDLAMTRGMFLAEETRETSRQTARDVWD